MAATSEGVFICHRTASSLGGIVGAVSFRDTTFVQVLSPEDKARWVKDLLTSTRLDPPGIVRSVDVVTNGVVTPRTRPGLQTSLRAFTSEQDSGDNSFVEVVILEDKDRRVKDSWTSTRRDPPGSFSSEDVVIVGVVQPRTRPGLPTSLRAAASEQDSCGHRTAT